MRRLLGVLAVSCVLAACQTTGGGVSEPHAGGGEPAGPGQTVNRKFQDENEFREWFAYYYRAPRPSELTSAIDYMKAHGYLDQYPDVAAAFISHLLAVNPAFHEAWMQDWTPYDQETWDVLLAALWFADTPETRRLYDGLIARGSRDKQSQYETLKGEHGKKAKLLEMDIVNPRQVNALWAGFSASGDLAYVQRVIDLLSYYGDESIEDPLAARRGQIGEAAVLSLAQSALLHELVARRCVEQQRSHKDQKTRVVLAALLQALEKAMRQPQ